MASPNISGRHIFLSGYLRAKMGDTSTTLKIMLSQPELFRQLRPIPLLHALELAHADGSYPHLLQTLARTHLLLLDDWLRYPLTRAQASDLLEILDNRYGRTATMVVTQVPVADWHSRIPDPILSDAIPDRLVHNAYRLELQGGPCERFIPPCSPPRLSCCQCCFVVMQNVRG